MQIYDTKLITAHPVPLNHPTHPRVPCSFLLHVPPSCLGGWHSRGLWDWLSWVELGKEIAGPLHPLTWPPQWAFVWSACAKPHPSSSNGFWSATGSLHHYCFAWVKPTDMLREDRGAGDWPLQQSKVPPGAPSAPLQQKGRKPSMVVAAKVSPPALSFGAGTLKQEGRTWNAPCTTQD